MSSNMTCISTLFYTDRQDLQIICTCEQNLFAICNFKAKLVGPVFAVIFV